MGLHHDDHFKRLKMLQDPTPSWPIAATCLDVEAMREAIKAMLDEQAVPLRGAT